MNFPDENEDDIFLATDEPNTVEPQIPAPPPVVSDQTAQAAVEGAPLADQEADGHKPTGDLNVALRHERERNREIQAELKREREDRAKLMQMLERSQPQAPAATPTPANAPPDFWEDPNAFVERQLKDRLTPYEEQLAETREYYSRREAIREHGEETVAAAYQALSQAVEAGKINGPELVASLRKSADPYADVVKWHQNRPEAQEQALRTRLEAEIFTKYGITPETVTAQPATPPPAAAPAPGPAGLPSLNQAHGNAGGQQSSAISEEDIFNATPAFGTKRKG